MKKEATQLPKQQGKLILICSASGGTGKTSLAVNLAVTLAKQKFRTALIDGDLLFGDASLMLHLLPKTGMKEAAERKDAAHIESYMEQGSCGVKFLSAPFRPEHAELISSEFIQEAAATLYNGSHFVIVDTQTGLTEHTLSLLDKADQLLVLTGTSLANLKNTKLFIETLDALHVKEKISLVINRNNKHTFVKASDTAALVGMKDAFLLPEDTKHLPLSIDKGEPLASHFPHTSYAKKVKELADALIPEKTTAEKSKPFSKLGKTMNRWKVKNNEFTSQTPVQESKGNRHT